MRKSVSYGSTESQVFGREDSDWTDEESEDGEEGGEEVGGVDQFVQGKCQSKFFC